MAARVVLVTGATRGVGRGIADAFARRGDTLVIVGRSTDAAPNRLGLPGTLEGVAGELRDAGSEVLTINADLARTEDAERVVREVQDVVRHPRRPREQRGGDVHRSRSSRSRSRGGRPRSTSTSWPRSR